MKIGPTYDDFQLPPHLLLSAAIIRQGCIDYRNAIMKKKPFPPGGSTINNLDELNDFFDSGWFQILSLGGNGDDYRRMAMKYIPNYARSDK